MKKFFTLLVLAACCAAMTWGCSDDKYDDTEIRQEIENLKQEIASMKEQVNSLKTIIDALNENKFITNYLPTPDMACSGYIERLFSNSFVTFDTESGTIKVRK